MTWFTSEIPDFWNNVHDFSTALKSTGTNLVLNLGHDSKYQIYTVFGSPAIHLFRLSKEMCSKMLKLSPFSTKRNSSKRISRNLDLKAVYTKLKSIIHIWPILSKSGDFYTYLMKITLMSLQTG